MKARYPGKCFLCKGRVDPSDEIKRHLDTGQMRHKDCEQRVQKLMLAEDPVGEEVH